MKKIIMQIIRHINNSSHQAGYDLPDNLRGAVLAIGNFDGVHLAHQSLLAAALQLANSSNSPKMVMSFSPHPKHYFVAKTPNFAIEPFAVRLRRLCNMGFDATIIMRFNHQLASMSAHDFIKQILQKQLAIKHVVVGDDFRFGKDRLGTPIMLQDYGIGCTAFSQIKLHDIVISSTNVRKYLSDGDITKAAILLGRPYEINGMVIHGNKRGRELGVRTINIALHGLHLPAFGVYAVRLFVGEETHHAIANIGVRPTFEDKLIYGNNNPLLEVHNFSPLPDLYGRKLRVQLLHHVRNENRFIDANALQKQINDDINAVKEYFLGAGTNAQ